MNRKLLVATTNAGKRREIEAALQGLPFSVDILSPLPEVDEDQDTFEGNALKKARVFAAHAGSVVLADDSGLVVAALGGDPGVHSARFAGPAARDEDNRKKLLKLMEGCSGREAAFVCVLALVDPVSKTEHLFTGRCEGEIALSERGENGFGYDSLFLIPSLGKTAAQLSLEEKQAVSHRGQALRALRHFLKSAGTTGADREPGSAIPVRR